MFMLFGYTLAAAAAVFACGVLADILRERVFGVIHRVLMRTGGYRRLAAKIERADAVFRAEDGQGMAGS